MDFYEGVVVEYLRADRAVFVNTQCCIQINPAQNPDSSGPHWYCDIVAVNFRELTVCLCEISYSAMLADLCNRLKQWNSDWPGLCNALVRDCHLPQSWAVRPWLFVPEHSRDLLQRKLATILPINGMPSPLVTSLEDVVPWKYNQWGRAIKDSCDSI
jgi:hypothetical protein